MEQNRVISVLAVGLMVLIYVLLRFFGLDAACLWFDEIYSVHAASHPWSGILVFTAKDLIHPPLFYILLKLWIGVGGDSQLWLRLLPAIISSLAVVPFLLIAKEFKLNFWQLLIALSAFAVNGSLIKYAQEVRMYSLLQFLSLISIWLFIRYFLKGKNLIPLIVLNVLLVHIHYYGWLVVGSEFTAILIFQRIKFRTALFIFGVCVGAFLPWGIAVLYYGSVGNDVGQNIGWISRPGLLQLLQLLFGLLEPIYYQATSADPFTSLIVMLPLIAFVIAIVILGLAASRSELNDSDALKVLSMFVVIPVVVALAISWIAPYSVWGLRHLIIVFAPSSLVLGIVAGRSQLRIAAPVFFAILIGFSGYAFWIQSEKATIDHIWCVWGPLATESLERKDAGVYVFEDLVAYHAWFEQNRSLGGRSNVIKVDNIEGVHEDDAYFLPRGFDTVKKIAIEDVTGGNVWIMYRAETIDESKAPVKPFKDLGYRIRDQKIVETTDGKAIRLLLER